MMAKVNPLLAFAQLCADDTSRLTYAERLAGERAVFASAKMVARELCGFELQSLSPSAKLDFEEYCDTQSIAEPATAIVRLAFEIVAMSKLVCSGQPYAIEGLLDPLATGRASAMATLSRRICRFYDQLTEHGYE